MRGLTRFVGRERELEQMRRALELAMSGQGQMVAVVAEAGTGKSRLYYEFKAALPAGCRVLEAYSVSHGKASAWLPVLELLRKYFGLADADDAAMRREKVRATLVALEPTLSDALPYLFGLLGIVEGADPIAQMDPQIKRQRTLDAIKRIVVHESLRQPLIVIFEDLHWIDEQTQALLDLLTDSIANARVLLLVNYRPEYRHEWSNKSHYVQIRLAAAGPRERRRAAGSPAGRRGRVAAAQAADHRAHRRQSVLYRRDGAGAVRRGRAGAQRRSEGDAVALAVTLAGDGARDPGGAHRPVVGGAEGTLTDDGGDRTRIAARTD